MRPEQSLTTLNAKTEASSGATLGDQPWKRRLRLLLALALILTASTYIAVNMEGRWQELQESAFSLPTWHWILLCAGITGTLALSMFYHVLLLSGIQHHSSPATRVAHAYAIGQLIRYVPGKVVGVVFQIGMLDKKVRAGSVLLALLVQTLHEYVWTFAFCGVLTLALLIHSLLPLLAFLPIAALLYWAHRHRPGERILLRLPLMNAHISLPPTTSPRHVGALTAVLLITWLPMVASLSLTFAPMLGLYDALLMACLYPLAAVASLVLVMVPSGLVVREAVFVWLGRMVGLPVDTLLFTALATRLAMTAAELFVALLASMIDALTSRGRYVWRSHE